MNLNQVQKMAMTHGSQYATEIDKIGFLNKLQQYHNPTKKTSSSRLEVQLNRLMEDFVLDGQKKIKKAQAANDTSLMSIVAKELAEARKIQKSGSLLEKEHFIKNQIEPEGMASYQPFAYQGHSNLIGSHFHSDLSQFANSFLKNGHEKEDGLGLDLDLEIEKVKADKLSPFYFERLNDHAYYTIWEDKKIVGSYMDGWRDFDDAFVQKINKNPEKFSVERVPILEMKNGQLRTLEKILLFGKGKPDKAFTITGLSKEEPYEAPLSNEPNGYVDLGEYAILENSIRKRAHGIFVGGKKRDVMPVAPIINIGQSQNQHNPRR